MGLCSSSTPELHEHNRGKNVKITPWYDLYTNQKLYLVLLYRLNQVSKNVPEIKHIYVDSINFKLKGWSFLESYDYRIWPITRPIKANWPLEIYLKDIADMSREHKETAYVYFLENDKANLVNELEKAGYIIQI